ncbi:hypothetical protein K505DRAFT_422178 [Melanomma pulvis-pyrius CBS 109.77]|uniref:Mid2 domain-containing protein n=1 Tax=Melanomma pulvis-pyrius CBS 109.77 TaxID=1314802 RepID=A0A6A6WS80_9PLEO|nr:hypothetical protein K505DRAFT_422178 [Melanomma pulvis-pyrius CBS 109.77]
MSRKLSNIGPLPTAFSLPSHCRDGLYKSCSTTSCDVQRGARCALSTASGDSSVVNDPGCWPSGDRWSTAIDLLQDDGVYFSPAVECPSGFIAAASGDVREAFPSLKNSETGIICCPSGMSYTIASRECRAQISSAVVIKCDGVVLEATSSVIVQSRTREYWAVASAVQLRFQATDLPTQTSTPTTSEASRSPPPTGTTVPAPKGLTTGAKIGVGVAVPLVAIGIAILAYIIWRRRRSSNTIPKTKGTATKEPLYELPGTRAPAHELPATQARSHVHELPE